LTAGGRDNAGVVRVVDSPTFTDRAEVVGHLQTKVAGAAAVAAAALDRHDVVIVQHEYGIYGGTDGDQVVELLHRVRAPVIVVLHTVLEKPTPHQRQVLEAVAARADAIVVMTQAARTRLVNGYAVNVPKVRVIPHGALEVPPMRMVSATGQPTILTWGLLGPGKGIEWVLAGLRELRHLTPRPRYIIAGQTHPKVLTEFGEAYRLGLYHKARAFGVGDMVRFERSYLDRIALARLVGRADVIVLPYDSRDQVTSGVLVEALAFGKPVIATPFPHAVELLSGGAGLLVPHCDSTAIGSAMKRVLTDPALAAGMRLAATRVTTGAAWANVADAYREVADGLLSEAAAAAS
jgi:glycosyltransferase involved in cell wall biosynthesis